jgi:uncharacterized membrane protein
MPYREVAETVGILGDLIGVAIIVVGIVVAMTRAAVRLYRRTGSYTLLRQDIGRTILLGLEVLVAADIIRTIAVDPSIESVLVLAAIVLVRTFLSVALEVELTGRWPWRRSEGTG